MRRRRTTPLHDYRLSMDVFKFENMYIYIISNLAYFPGLGCCRTKD